MSSPREQKEQQKMVEPSHEIITAFLSHHRKSIVDCAEDFLRNPTEETFTPFYFYIIGLITQNERNVLSLFIKKLKEKEKSGTVTPAELILLGFGSEATDKVNAQHYYTKAKTSSSDSQITIIALTRLGSLHADLGTATHFLQEAALQGGGVARAYLVDTGRLSPENINNPGVFCCVAIGKSLYLSKKFAQAYDYFVKSAKLGYPYAMYLLGRMFEYGEHLKQDYAQAALFYRLANSKLTPQNEVSIWKGRSNYETTLNVMVNKAPEESHLFIDYQRAMYKKDKTQLSTFANTNPAHFLQCMTDSHDSWDEVKPLLKENVSKNIENLLTVHLVPVLRDKGFNAGITRIMLSYIGYSEHVVALEINNHERICDLEAKRCEAQNKRFDASLAAFIKMKRPYLDVTIPDGERTKDIFLWSQASPDIQRTKKFGIPAKL